MPYRISVATICFNNPEELKRTIAAVDQQQHRPYEHVIIDGSTSDAIRNYLENTDQPSYRWWVCERDNGIADAFNKGVHKSGVSG